MKIPRYAFFLGGRDLEMCEIGNLLHQLKNGGDGRIAEIYDKKLAWGACVSDFEHEVNSAINDKLIPVLLELECDIDIPDYAIEIDHHGARTGEPSALFQLFTLLDLPKKQWTRHYALVDANDRGHIAEMRKIGASDVELVAIRKADRSAQGISEDEEKSGLRALDKVELACDASLLVVRLPHERTATVSDPLALSGETRDLLVLCPRSTHFFGRGDRIMRLDQCFSGGWRGGLLPERGFWGLPKRLGFDAVINVFS